MLEKVKVVWLAFLFDVFWKACRKVKVVWLAYLENPKPSFGHLAIGAKFLFPDLFVFANKKKKPLSLIVGITIVRHGI